MATKAVIARENKRAKLNRKYIAKYNSYKQELQRLYVLLDDQNQDHDKIISQIDEYQTLLQRIPRNATTKRRRNRCYLTGRPRGVYRKFKLSRNMLRKLAMLGLVPGVRKASW